MSAVGSLRTWISPEEYLRGELLSEVRHEYCAGEVWPMGSVDPVHAMSGASENHNYIAGDIFTELNLSLRGKTCRAFMNDMKVRIRHESEDWYYYPDVLVNCDPAGQHKYYCETPAVIFEVLSPDSESRDRREKRMAYEKFSSLHTYVLVAQDRREILVLRRTSEGWSRELLPDAGNAVRLPEIGCEIPLDAIYARTGL